MNIVATIRNSEVTKLRLTAYVRATYLAFIVITSRTVLFLTLISFVLMGHHLRPDITYMLATYFEILQLTTALMFPQALILASETMVSIRRLEVCTLYNIVQNSSRWSNLAQYVPFQQFLLLEEHENEGGSPLRARRNSLLKFKKQRKSEKKVEIIGMTNGRQNTTYEVGRDVPPSVILERVTATWTPRQLPPTLSHLSIKIEGGNLCALIGSVGSGKSSILNLLLKELPLGAGKVHVTSKAIEENQQNKQGYIVDVPNLKISYASQEAWLFSGTVRENILFGQPFDRDRYIAVSVKRTRSSRNLLLKF